MIRDLTDLETREQYEGFKDDSIESLRAKVAEFTIYYAESINNPGYVPVVRGQWLSRVEAVASAYQIRYNELLERVKR